MIRDSTMGSVANKHYSVKPFIDRLSIKGIKRGFAMIRRCSYHNSLPSPPYEGGLEES